MELEARIRGPGVRPQPTTTRLWGYPATIAPMQAFPDVEGENGAEGANCEPPPVPGHTNGNGGA